MRKKLVFASLIMLAVTMMAQTSQTIQLELPDLDAGKPLMQALALRASARAFDTADIDLHQLSGLLWAGNGVNRMEEGKRTAPTAMNSQDIDLYVVMKSGTWLYDAKNHVLNLVSEGDHRIVVAGSQPAMAKAPVFILVVSDVSRFKRGEENQKLEWAALDAGFVAQNILLYCASEGLACRPRSWMERQQLKEILKLNESRLLMLNIPVSKPVQ